MIRVDGHYLYQVGHQIHPISEFKHATPTQPQGTTKGEAFLPLYIAKGALETLLTRSVFQLRTSIQSGQNLLSVINEALDSIDTTQVESYDQPLDSMIVYKVKSAVDAFEAILGAELALIPLYVVTPKGGYDLALLTESGLRFFPDELVYKVPRAVADIEEAAKCLAFERFTAAGFHLHRANESVLRSYWDVVTEGADHPEQRNMGVYINEMDNRSVGNENVKSALKDLKNFHRNPLIHPDHSIKNADKAIALMNAVHNTITHMLDEIPILEDDSEIDSESSERQTVVPPLAAE